MIYIKNNSLFDEKKKIINSKTNICIININEIDSKLKTLMDNYFVKICEGNSDSDLKTVKTRVKMFLQQKKENITMGAIAEFFIHLYLNAADFKQECLFLNLEEGSIKKGFDGYYSKENEEWIMESKSGTISTKNITHAQKLSEAYQDLIKKVQGNVTNNPWHNAYNHASHADVGTKKDIRSRIKKLSDDFTNKVYFKIDNFNIIPCSTIFLENKHNPQDKDILCDKVESSLKNYTHKKIILICISQKSIDLFIDYLGK